MYDAIVVGARCAGSPTAMLLARKGHRVLLVDKASFPSDTLSAHYIHQPGVAKLHRWGLLDKVVASGCPPVERQIFDVGPFALTGSPPPVDGITVGYAPRRTILESISAESPTTRPVPSWSPVRSLIGVPGAARRPTTVKCAANQSMPGPAAGIASSARAWG